jgi:hypothetical protein
MSNVSVFPGVFNSSITPAGLPWDTYSKSRPLLPRSVGWTLTFEGWP